MRLKNHSIIFDALWRGLSIHIKGLEYRLDEIKDMTLHNFIKLCQTASDEEISIICEMKRRR